MKHTLINYVLIIASALCLSGCEEHTDSSSTKPNVKYFNNSFHASIYSMEIEGHEYIIFDGYYKGGIIHSESCPCKKETTNE